MLTAMCHVGAAPQCNLPQSYLARSSIGHEDIDAVKSMAAPPRIEVGVAVSDMGVRD